MAYGNGPVNAVDALGLESKAQWQQKAQAEIAGYTNDVPAGADELKTAIVRNRYITAAYARMYLQDTKHFPFLGLAAFGSNEVGLAMTNLRSQWLAARDDQRNYWGNYVVGPGALFTLPSRLIYAELARVPYNTAKYLGDGNLAVFNHIYWQFLAYDKGGIFEMRRRRRAGELSDDALKAWCLIDTHQDDKIWQGNKMLFYIEQHDILQPTTFDNLPTFSTNVGEWIAEGAVPLFPGATRFGAVGRNVADFNQRWTWITNNLWPEWETYSGQHQDQINTQMQLLTNPRR